MAPSNPAIKTYSVVTSFGIGGIPDAAELCFKLVTGQRPVWRGKPYPMELGDRAVRSVVTGKNCHAVAMRLTLMALPTKCPELNPNEKVWQFMRDNWRPNRISKSHEDILDHCCFAWNKLIDQPWRIMSTGFRDWAHAS